MHKLELTRDASDDLLEILRYLNTEAGAGTALRFNAGFDRVFGQLARYPDHGAPRPRLGAGIRLSPVAPYNVYSRYDAITKVVYVVRILDGRRRITREMMRPR